MVCEVNEAKGKQDDNEIEEDRTAEAKSVKSKLKDMVCMCVFI